MVTTKEIIDLMADESDDEIEIEEQFTCTRCTLLNPITAPICEACQARNPSIPHRVLLIQYAVNDWSRMILASSRTIISTCLIKEAEEAAAIVVVLKTVQTRCPTSRGELSWVDCWELLLPMPEDGP